MKNLFNTLCNAVLIAVMICGAIQVSQAQLLDDDLESGGDPINNGLYFSDFQPGPLSGTANEGHYMYGNDMQSFYGNGSHRYDHTLGNADGHMLIYDGFTLEPDSPDRIVWSTTVDLIPSFSYNFIFFGRNRFSTGAANDVTLELRLNGNTVTHFTIPAQVGWEDFNIPISGGGAGSLIEIVQTSNTFGQPTDFALDDFLIDCECDRPNPTMSTSGNSNYTVNVCSAEELLVSASPHIDCDNMHHFFGIRDLDNNEVNAAWLTNTEIQELMSGMDLQNFASSTHANPWDNSVTTFGLEPGKCYEIKYAAQTSCFVWEEVVQKICIREEGECDCTVNSIFDSFSEYPGGPVYFQTASTAGNNMLIVQYSIDFGDGSPVQWSNSSTAFGHTYSGGVYSVCLTTYGINTLTGECCEDSYCVSMIIEGEGDKDPWPHGDGDFRGESNNDSKPRESAVVIAPNPNNGQMQVFINSPQDVRQANIQLLDQAGRLISDVASNKALEKGMTTLYLNERGLATGIYFLKIDMDGKVQTEKVLIE